MELKDRLAGLVRALPPAQRTGIAVALLVLVMAAVPFVRWVTTPSYTVLYGGLADTELASVVSHLDAQGVPYQLEGSRVLVPQDRIHLVRVGLAEAGISGAPSVPGYELLDAQALGVSDFRQRVDLQRAVEGELARTLGAMDAIDAATVRLVLPEDSLFAAARNEASASVLVRTSRQLGQGQVEAITLLVSSAVEGLEPDAITVADTTGAVLHAPGDGATGGVGDRQQRRTREYERALAADLTQLLQRATDAPASVVVRAVLDFDEVETQVEELGDDPVTLRESTSREAFEGNAMVPGGVVGVDGGPLPTGGAGNEGTYEREEQVRELGVGRITTRTLQAPGAVEQLSVALVVDEGAPIADAELQALVAAAAGIDVARGDQIAISRVATPPMTEVELVEEQGGLLDQLQQLVALVMLLVIVVALFLMSRRRRSSAPALAPGKAKKEKVVPAQVRAPAQLPADEVAAAAAQLPTAVKDEVSELVERQPEEIAALLRGWLADRRAPV